MMTIEQYARAVKQMRDMQKRYFQTRSDIVLDGVKNQERKVDEMTNEILLAQ